METNGQTRSLWFGTASVPQFQPLPGAREADVVVVGAGITGITAAVLLKRAGRKVILLEGLGVLGGETGRTTSHTTQILDHRYHTVESSFGREGARLVAESMGAAIDRIERFVDEKQIACGFERVPGYLYAETDAQARELDKELEAARRAGLAAHLEQGLPMPFPVQRAMRVDGQAQFHPVEYLSALLEEVPGDGCHVFTHTRVLEVHDGAPCRVVTDRGTVRCGAVFVASHAPINNKVFLQTKVAPYRTYAVAARLDTPFPEGLFWDMYDPYHYTRRQRTADGEYLIVGGEDHRVGKEDEARALAQLERYVRERFGLVDIAYRWSGQVEEPVDGLAFIGRNSASRNVYVATGFSGTGMTWGTLAAMVVTDQVLGRDNRYEALYAATRIKPLASAKEFLVENAEFPYHLVKDRLVPAEAKAVTDVRPGEGRLVQRGGEKVAVYRDETGTLHAMSPVCTHMGCHVQWNGTERTWDCPCHGGRYDATGHVVSGPPVRRLAPVSLEERARPVEGAEAAAPEQE